MTGKAHSSVRMGPITLLVLVVVLCLAVLTMLTLVTAHSQRAVTQQQAATLEAGYRNEVAAEGFVAQVDGILAQGRNGASSRSEVETALEQLCTYAASQQGSAGSISTTAIDVISANGAATEETAVVIEDESVFPSAPSSELSIEDARYDAQQGLLSATFKQEGGRKLSIELSIEDDFTYAVLAWRATTEWTEPGTGNMLWEG